MLNDSKPMETLRMTYLCSRCNREQPFGVHSCTPLTAEEWRQVAKRVEGTTPATFAAERDKKDAMIARAERQGRYGDLWLLLREKERRWQFVRNSFAAPEGSRR